MTAQNILDEEKKTSSACGTACGATDGDETKKEETPTACGSSCGAGE